MDYYAPNYSLNDFIKISYHKLCLISTSLDRNILYITLINIFGENNVIIRYYYMDFFILFKYKIFLDIKGCLYKNFISFAFSFCRYENCENEQNDEYNSAFIIFSYSNSSDYCLNIENYLFKYNEIKIDNILIDLNKNITIENNLFGNVFSGIRIDNMINCENINLKSVEKNLMITINYTLEQNEKIKLIFLNNEYKTTNCRISYVYIITDPDFEDANKYPEMKDPYHGGEETKEKYNSQKELYIGRNSYYDILLENDLITNCKNSKCELCLNINKNYCITCNSNFTIVENNGINNKICDGVELEETNNLDENVSDSAKDSENISIEQTYENISDNNNEYYDDETKSEEGIFLGTYKNKEEEENFVKNNTLKEDNNKACTMEQIINNLCLEGILTSEEILEILNILKNDLFNNFNNDDNRIILTKNVVFQVSTLEQQKKTNNSKISSIEFGECESVLKNEYKLSRDDQLKIIKMDIKNDDLSKTNVQYELYRYNSTDKLNLKKCENTNIILNIPNNLEPDIIKLYNRLEESGYNLFDYNDSFYNDVCSPYTTSNNTDILLNDRQKDIFIKTENISLCQDNCRFNSFNLENSKAKCECNIQKESIKVNISTINFENNFDNKKFVISFWNTIKNSNFLVLKCYKLALNMKNFLKNYGIIIMTILFILYIVFLMIFIFKERKKINNDIQTILNKNFNFSENSVKKIMNINDFDNSNIKNSPSKNSMDLKKLNIPEKDKSRNKTKILNGFINSRNQLMNMSERTIKKIENYKNIKATNYKHKKKKRKSYTKKKSKCKLNENNIDVYKSKTILIKNNKKIFRKNSKNKKDNKDNKSINMNDNELNNLDYENALIYDKRTYFEYYCSLLKRKQLILFTFLPVNDYNLFSIKISLFILSFSLYFTINGFFFTDETMHKIYADKNKSNFLYQIPQILYSSIVSSIINALLKILSLSEKNIIEIKRQKSLDEAIYKSKNIKRYLSIKFIIFFIFGIFLLLFFWYYIACFCAVYINTQIILIKDTLISFIFSMFYPFVLSLLPGVFRIPSLRSNNKEKIYLYKISELLALI